MINTRELEKRWLVYKIKSYIPHLIIAISLIVIVSLLTFFIPKKEKITSDAQLPIQAKKTPIPMVTPPLKKVNKRRVVAPKKEKQLAKVAPVPTLHIPDAPTLTLQPSLGFMRKIQNSTLPYYRSEAADNKITTEKPNPVKEKILQEPVTIIEKRQIQKSKITIERRDTRDDIKNVIQRFKKNNNPALSLFIAKKYYELGEYHKSYNYALVTNQINRNIEESWIIFTKSLVKLGEREMAVKTLEDYIKNSHSSNAKLLLEDINSGKFR